MSLGPLELQGGREHAVLRAERIRLQMDSPYLGRRHINRNQGKTEGTETRGVRVKRGRRIVPEDNTFHAKTV